MIYIVIPVFNRMNFTVNCLRSLQKQEYSDFRIIVVDDGSTDGTTEYIRSYFPQVILLQGDGNLWWTGATNLGVQKALKLSKQEADYILTLNNDLEVKENYLQELLNVANKNPDALIGSVSLDINEPDTIHFAGTLWNAKTAKYRPALTKNIGYQTLLKSGENVNTDLLPGRGVLIPIKLFNKIGVYDFNSFPHYMADEDFSLRAKEAGYKLLIATGAAVYNHVNETGLKKQKRNLRYYKMVFTSIKSPVNFRNRWNWAKRHARIAPPIYFICDMTRIFKGILFNG